MNRQLTAIIVICAAAPPSLALASAAPAPEPVLSANDASRETNLIPPGRGWSLISKPADNFERALDRAEVEAREARRAAKRKRERREERSFELPAGVTLATLESIAACESGGDPTAVNPAGYFGKYQFDEGTWAAVGGEGNPAEASESEQDYRAALLYNQSGASPWPVCG